MPVAVWGGGGPVPQLAEEALQLFAGLPWSTLPQSGALGGLRTPSTMDAQGNLYGTVDCTIRTVAPDGSVATPGGRRSLTWALTWGSGLAFCLILSSPSVPSLGQPRRSPI